MNRLIGVCWKIGTYRLLLLTEQLELLLLDSRNLLECLRIQWVLLLLQPNRVKLRLELVRFSGLGDKPLLLLRSLCELVVILLLM